jgi:membrane fusion protein (multidrug efflux system)
MADEAGQQPGGGERKSRRHLYILAGVVAALSFAWALYWLFSRDEESTDDAYTDGDVVAMAPKVAGYVVELHIDDNLFVHAGDILLRIEPDDYRAQRDQAAATLAVAGAQMRGAEANLAVARIAYPARLAQAEAQLRQAQANRFQAAQSYIRQTSVERRATTQENIDSATAQARAAGAQVAHDQAQVDIAEPVDQYLEQAAAQVAQWRAQVAQAQAQLDLAELNLAYTTLRAPQAGWVTRRNVQLGSYLQAGQPVFALVAPQLWVTANFKESQLDRMRPGQAARIRVDAYPDLRLQGHVDSIQMGSGSRFSAFPAENATGNFVKIVQRVPVKIVIDSGLPAGLPLPLGLSVVPTVGLP